MSLKNAASKHASNQNKNFLSTACPGRLFSASLPISINRFRLTAAVDSERTRSPIHSFIRKTLNLDICLRSHQEQTATTAMKKTFCVARHIFIKAIMMQPHYICLLISVIT